MEKKIFTVVLTTSEVGKTESLHFAASDSRAVLPFIPEGREVVAITFGPAIQII